MRVANFKIAIVLTLALLSGAAWSQNKSADLDRLLTKMDATGKSFHSAEASFIWDQYQKVVDETDTQKGKIYFRRQDSETQMAAEISEMDKKSEPDKKSEGGKKSEPDKYVVYAGGKVQVYQPKIDQVNEYNAGKNRSDLESFLVLGFGGSGHDMLKSYDVKLLGPETVGGVETQKLELIPKSERMRNNVARILLWIDPARGVSVQQQFFESSGDYRLAKYSDIQVNQKLPDGVFKLKTTSKTRVISPKG